jgi:glycerophosphoryl diester phosphodiesterase
MVLNIAHRGFSGKYPENTLLSIRKAVELGADFIEIDAWLSLDHQVFVIHDNKLNRTTNGSGPITSKTADQIREYRIKKGGQKVPLLEEVFPLIKKGTGLNIEIKNMWAAKSVAELIKKHKMQDKVMVSSGSILALQIIKNEMPLIKTAYIFYISNNPRWGYFATFMAKLLAPLTHFYVSMVAKSAKVGYVNLSYPFATKKFIKKLHKRDFKVNVWTVNTRALMRKLIKHKVDGIITNRPDVLKKILKERKIISS